MHYIVLTFQTVVDMPVPEAILAVPRPSSTVVRKSGDKYLVIKRTSRRRPSDGRPVPVDLGTVGEIVRGRYVAKREAPLPKRQVDVKSYGRVKLCDSVSGALLQDLADVWDIPLAKRLYALALLRAAYGDIRDRDVETRYSTSFLSEMLPGVPMSRNAISSLLERVGEMSSLICEFMRNRVSANAALSGNLVVDGMLKNFNSESSALSRFSRKARVKGSKDVSLLYAFNPETMEPIAARAYPGNMIDMTALGDFIEANGIRRGLMVFDKGFYDGDVLDRIDEEDGLDYLIPLKLDSKLIPKYGMDNPDKALEGFKDATVMYRKVKTPGKVVLYSFRNPWLAAEQEIAYVEQAKKKGAFSEKAYNDKKRAFGLVVFRTKSDIPPLLAYQAYDQRWDIEVMFGMYKGIIDRDTVNVHTDYRVVATEFVNFISSIIAMRVKKLLMKKGLNKKYSFKQVMSYLDSYQMARTSVSGSWQPVTMLSYIKELADKLGV